MPKGSDTPAWCPHCNKDLTHEQTIYVPADGARNPSFVACRICNRRTVTEPGARAHAP